MFTGVVKGSVTSMTKHRSLKGVRLVIVHPLNPLTGLTTGAPQIAVDVLGAAVGANVVVSSDGDGVQAMLRVGKDCPVRLMIVALVDALECAKPSPQL